MVIVFMALGFEVFVSIDGVVDSLILIKHSTNFNKHFIKRHKCFYQCHQRSQVRKKRADLREGQTRFGVTVFQRGRWHGKHLDAQGVPVLSCEQDNFSAFHTRDSGFGADFRLDDAAAMTCEEIDALTQQALAEAKAQGITGKAVYPSCRLASRR